MSLEARAAQFAPFAALTGHDEAISEIARLTDKLGDISEDELSHMNQKMGILSDHLHQHPVVSVTYFQPDQKKDGGAYGQYTGQVRLIDQIEYCMIFVDGSKIPLNYILDIESSLFKDLGKMME